MGENQVKTSGTRGQVVAAMAVLLLAAFAATYNGRVDGPLDMYHEGERLAHMDTLLAGGLPYRDVYVPHGLGEDVLKPLAARKLFGDSVASLRRLGQNNYVYRGLLPPLGALSIVLAAWVITRSGIAAGIACALVALGLYEVSERHVFGMLSVASLAMFMHVRRDRWLVVAGLLAALAGLYSLEVGLYALAIGSAWIPLNAWIQSSSRRTVLRNLLAFAAGFLIGAAPFFAWAAWHGIIPNFWANVAMQLFQRKELYPVGYPTPSWMSDQPILDNLKVAGGTLLLFYVIPISYVAATVVAVSRRGEPDARSRVLLAALTGAAFWITVLGRADLWHAAFACAGFFVFVATMATSLKGLIAGRFMRCAALAFGIATVVANLWIGQWGAIGRNWIRFESAFFPLHLRSDDRPMRPTTIPRLAGMAIPVDQADYLETVVNYLQSHTSPDETILDLSDQGLLFYLCERGCPTRFAFVNYCGTAALRAEMVGEITKRKALPAYLIRYTTDVSTPDALGDFVDRHYRLDAQVGPTVLMQLISSGD